jgi:hypothetical protein
VEAITEEVETHASKEIILVGHSGAGRSLPVVGEELSEGVSAYVFVDSDIPFPPAACGVRAASMPCRLMSRCSSVMRPRAASSRA